MNGLNRTDWAGFWHNEGDCIKTCEILMGIYSMDAERIFLWAEVSKIRGHSLKRNHPFMTEIWRNFSRGINSLEISSTENWRRAHWMYSRWRLANSQVMWKRLGKNVKVNISSAVILLNSRVGLRSQAFLPMESSKCEILFDDRSTLGITSDTFPMLKVLHKYVNALHYKERSSKQILKPSHDLFDRHIEQEILFSDDGRFYN